MLKKKITISDIQAQKLSKNKFTMITVYDFPMASIVERSAIEMILVGDSLGKVIQGQENTISVSIEDIIYHLKIVRKGAPNTFIVGDMPFLSYEVDTKDAIRNAGILIKNGADCVKIEGGINIAHTIRAVVNAGIPVMAHINFQALKTIMTNSNDIIQEAKVLEEAGAFAVVLQFLPSKLAASIDHALRIPTIGFGAGPHTSGQNLNAYGMLGILDEPVKNFVKQYLCLGEEILKTFNKWHYETQQGIFPASEHFFEMEKD